MSGAKALAGQRMHAAVCGATMVAESARAAAVAFKVSGPASDAPRSARKWRRKLRRDQMQAMAWWQATKLAQARMYTRAAEAWRDVVVTIDRAGVL